jgi:hypothetical protein
MIYGPKTKSSIHFRTRIPIAACLGGARKNIQQICNDDINVTDSNTVISREANLPSETHLESYSSSSDPILRDLHFNTYVPLVLSMALARPSFVPLLALALAHLPLVQHFSASDHVSSSPL